MTALEFRAAQPIGVSYPERIIELIVAPYETETVIEERTRSYSEIVAPGAFDGIERRANRVRVNYHHQDNELRHLLGRAAAFYPNRPEGLVARLRIRKGEHGDDALSAADDGILGASAGFAIMPGGETWPTRTLRRLTRLFLDHIALTPDPAYPTAEVLAVRHRDQPPAEELAATPNLDLLRQWELEDQYPELRT